MFPSRIDGTSLTVKSSFCPSFNSRPSQPKNRGNFVKLIKQTMFESINYKLDKIQIFFPENPLYLVINYK